MSIHSLGYITIEAADPEQWHHYLTQVVGMMDNSAALAGDTDSQYFKMDERPYRVAIEPAAADSYGVSGWETTGPEALADSVAAIKTAGYEVIQGSPEQIARRQVQDLVMCEDPDGNRLEIFWGVISDSSRFVSPVGVRSFITGTLGMGHAVLPAAHNYTETLKFYTEVLGFGVSDLMKIRYTDDPAEPEKRLHFMHCNGRHHSLAIFEQEFPTRCVHLMTEVEDVDEVGYAMDRRINNEVMLTGTLGRHTNDHTYSFYMAAPGGFAWEIGCQGLVVDDWDQYSQFHSTANSFWGHDFSVGQPPPE